MSPNGNLFINSRASSEWVTRGINRVNWDMHFIGNYDCCPVPPGVSLCDLKFKFHQEPLALSPQSCLPWWVKRLLSSGRRTNTRGRRPSEFQDQIVVRFLSTATYCHIVLRIIAIRGEPSTRLRTRPWGRNHFNCLHQEPLQMQRCVPYNSPLVVDVCTGAAHRIPGPDSFQEDRWNT